MAGLVRAIPIILAQSVNYPGRRDKPGNDAFV
jgi:hypothetical protein